MNNINMTLYGLVFIILLAFIYFKKEKIHFVENDVYSLLIISSFIGCILEVISFLCVSNGASESDILYILSIKILFANFLLWISLFTLYFVIITLNKDNKTSKKIILYSLLILILLALVVSLLPITFEETTNGLLLPTGVSVNAIYFLCSICIIMIVLLIFFNFKKMKNKKYWPLFIILISFSFMIVIQNIYPDILLVNPTAVLITFIMYFTIENPDVRMIEQLNIARDQADKANRAKTEFLSNMSHEIRTPLNAIVGFSNLLLEDKNLPDASKDEVKDIIMASDNLLEIVNGILDISKIEANKMEIEDKEYSIKKVIDELVKLTKGRIAEKPIEFKVSIDETIPPVLYGDAQKIKQICVNILTNAVKYTKEGWIELKINHVVKDDICRLIISVEDTGIGIKEGNINRLFDKFDRLDISNTATIEGTGLGLAITKKLLDLMGGKIVVQSVFGKGSRFTISLDQKIVKNPTIKLDEDVKVEAKVQISSEKLVLIVDDNKINLKVAERLLDSYGIKSVSVDNGYAAIEKIKNGEKYDLILMDDMMPKLSGTETFHELEKIPNFKIPVIALTANALTGEKEKYLAEGFNDYLAKPIDKEELNRIINKYLNQE